MSKIICSRYLSKLGTTQGFKRNASQKTREMLRKKRMTLWQDLNLCCRATAEGRTRTTKRFLDKLIADSLIRKSLYCLRNPHALIQSHYGVYQVTCRHTHVFGTKHLWNTNWTQEKTGLDKYC